MGVHQEQVCLSNVSRLLQEQGRATATAFGQGGPSLSSGLESQPLAMDVNPSSNCCTTRELAGDLSALPMQLFPEQAAEVFEALHLTLVLALTVICLCLSPAKGCEVFSLQPVRLLGWATSKGLCMFTGQMPPACSPGTRDMSTAARWLFSPGELCSLLSKYLCSTDSEPGGRQKDRLACKSATVLGNGPLPQPLALPVPISSSRSGRRGMRLICL